MSIQRILVQIKVFICSPHPEYRHTQFGPWNLITCRWNLKLLLLFFPVHFLPFPPSRFLPLSRSLQNSRIPLHQSAAMLKVIPQSSTTFPLPPELSFSLQLSRAFTHSPRRFFTLISYPLMLSSKPVSSLPVLVSSHHFCFLMHSLILSFSSAARPPSVWYQKWAFEKQTVRSLSLARSLSHTHPPPRQRCTHKNVAAVVAVQL